MHLPATLAKNGHSFINTGELETGILTPHLIHYYAVERIWASVCDSISLKFSPDLRAPSSHEQRPLPRCSVHTWTIIPESDSAGFYRRTVRQYLPLCASLHLRRMLPANRSRARR
ncbi:hypothetical protein AOLI_G00107440 [Acnodon oligacanthus]